MLFESQPRQEKPWRVDYEPLHWHLDETAPMPRRERAAARGPYRASIPSSKPSTHSPTATAAPAARSSTPCCATAESPSASPCWSPRDFLRTSRTTTSRWGSTARATSIPSSRRSPGPPSGRRILVDGLVLTHLSWLDRVRARSDAAVWRALPLVVSQPAVTVNYLMDNLGISQPAALRAVNQMIEAGVLESVGNPQRSRVWAAPEVTSALDAVAARAGRRTYAPLDITSSSASGWAM